VRRVGSQLPLNLTPGYTSFEMKGLRKILWVSWTAKKTNEWVLNEAGVKRELLNTVKARKLAYYGHTIRKRESCLEKEIMQGTIRMTEDRDKWCGQPSDRGRLKNRTDTSVVGL